MTRIIQIGFLFFPFVFLTSGVIHVTQLNTFLLVALLLIATQIRNPWLRIFSYYVIASQVYLFLYLLRLKISPAEVNLAYRFTLMMGMAIIIFIAVTKSKASNTSFYNVICISALLQAALGIMQLWKYDPVFNIYQHLMPMKRSINISELCGTMGNPNFYAAYLAICIPFFFRKHWFYFIPILAALILSSNTFTAMVALVVGCVYYFKDRIKLRWIGITLIPFLAWIIYQKQSWTIRFFDPTWASHDRLDFWAMALKKSFHSWHTAIFGCGAGAYWGPFHGEVFPMHNDWLDVFFRFGLIGAFLIGMTVYTLHRGNRMLYTAFLIAAVDAIGSYPFHLAPSLFLIMIIVGLMEREKYARQTIN